MTSLDLHPRTRSEEEKQARLRALKLLSQCKKREAKTPFTSTQVAKGTWVLEKVKETVKETETDTHTPHP